MVYMFDGCESLTEECRVKLKAQGFKRVGYALYKGV